jgi:hypothetical protein
MTGHLGYLLKKEELRDLYRSLRIVRIMKSRKFRRARVNRMVETRNSYRILVGKSLGKPPIGRPRRRWEYRI